MSPPVTLVTGASRGIGRYLAEHYVGMGHRVVGCGRSEIDWTLEGFDYAIADVADEIAVKRLFADLRRNYESLDHLINNAGVAAMNHSMLTPLSTVHRLLDTNVVGTFLFCREAAKLMQARRYGRIVNFSTVAVALKQEGEAVYAASKAAVESLTQVLARELAPLGITVNAVGPTAVDTELTRSVPKQKLDRLLERQAIPRFATPQAVANVIDFYLRRESDLITGQTLYLGGV